LLPLLTESFPGSQVVLPYFPFFRLVTMVFHFTLPCFSPSALVGCTPVAGLGRLLRDCAGIAPNRESRAVWHVPRCHSHPDTLRGFCACPAVSCCFCRRGEGEQQNQPETAEQGTTIMKQEEINRRTKEAVDYLVESLESGRSEVLVQYLAAMGRFHNYSLGNIMLIARQKPDATRVAGFRTWNSLGRFVNKGERGILILAPMVRRKPEERESLPEEAVATDRELFGFRAAYVFDISQTGGNDLPHLTEVQGDVVGLRERLTAWLAGQAITVVHSADIAPARGVSSGGQITLLPGLLAAEEFATLVHEVAHELLHRGDRRLETTKQIRETEAEAVAFVVCESLGLETGSASADYIQLWHGDAKLLTASLGIIQRTSAVILTALSPTEKREVDRAGPPRVGSEPAVC